MTNPAAQAADLLTAEHAKELLQWARKEGGWNAGCTAALRSIASGAAVVLPAPSEPPDWLPISSAPRTGEHILVSDRRKGQTGFGILDGKHQPFAVVAHWFDDGAGESGFYPSATPYDPDALQNLTHWKPL